jgi:hypothetical protein
MINYDRQSDLGSTTQHTATSLLLHVKDYISTANKCKYPSAQIPIKTTDPEFDSNFEVCVATPFRSNSCALRSESVKLKY